MTTPLLFLHLVMVFYLYTLALVLVGSIIVARPMALARLTKTGSSSATNKIF